MTVEQAISGVDGLAVNYAYDEETKTKWLSELDAEVALNTTFTAPPKYEYPEDKATTLLIPFPYDDIYILYLKAKMAFFNDDLDLYNNFAYAANERLEEFKDFYIRKNRPVESTFVKDR